DGEAEPHHHDDFRFYIVQPVVTRDEADAQACDRRHDRPDRDDGGDGRANTAALRPLIAGETPAEPEDGLKLRPVHAGSALEPAQLRFGVWAAADDREERVFEGAGRSEGVHAALMHEVAPRDDADVGAELLDDLEHV